MSYGVTENLNSSKIAPKITAILYCSKNDENFKILLHLVHFCNLIN